MATPCETKLDDLNAKLEDVKALLQQLINIIGG